MKNCFSTAVFLALFFVSVSVFAENTVTIATTDWEPYVGQSMKNNGFSAEIVTAAYSKVGYKVVFQFYPWARSVKLSKEGKVDALFPAYWNKERKESYIFTDPYTSGLVGFFKPAGKKITYSKLKDLVPYRIGVVRGYANTPEFDAADYLTKDESTTDYQNIKKLLKERIDLFVCDKFVGYHLIHQKLPHMKGQIKFISPALKDQKIYICMSKAIPDASDKVKAFNKGLAIIKADGTYDKIMSKHGF